MKNFAILFSRPWFLLLLIGIAALTLIPHFRLSKKYRRTRNRIIPIVLHLVIATFAITLLAGISFSYSVPNKENELILVVDVSDTTVTSEENRDEIVETILSSAAYDGFKVGVVTFGFGNSLAVPMSYDVQNAYKTYKSAKYPSDLTATDIASAVSYAEGLFTNPQTGKIVLVTDGKETDGKLSSAVRSLAAKGVMLDTVKFNTGNVNSDVQVSAITVPSGYIKQGEKIVVSTTLNANKPLSAKLTLYVDEVELETKTVALIAGERSLDFNYTFESRGIHTLKAVVTAEDSNSLNNSYVSYINVETYDNVLIISQFDDSEYIAALLSGKGVEGKTSFLLGEIDTFKVTSKKITDSDLPRTVAELRNYDEVIINNVSNAAMKEVDGFVDALYSYVYDYGGGLLTVGGNDADGNTNLYAQSDLENSKFQEMLPIDAINYTPPLGVMVVVDVSGSMSEELLNRAKAGAKSMLNVMSERDYLGVMTLSSNYSRQLPLTSVTEKEKILNSIDNLSGSGGTSFSAAVTSATTQLTTNESIDRRHIVILSDCQVTGIGVEAFKQAMTVANKQHKVTLSIVGVNLAVGSEDYNNFQPLCEQFGGHLYAVSGDFENISNLMRNDINTDEIKDVNLKPVKPEVYPSSLANSITSNLKRADGSNTELNFMLSGFYGGKIKNAEYLVLTGQYRVPIYALRTFGKGKVGSFMCDLNGNYSIGPHVAEDEEGKEYEGLLDSATGQMLVYDIIYSIMPEFDVKPREVALELEETNYTNTLNIYSTIGKSDKLEITITDLADETNTLSLKKKTGDPAKDDIYVLQGFEESIGYSQAKFVLTRAGVYAVKARLERANGEVFETVVYKSFAYSKEYDYYADEAEAIRTNLSTSSQRTGGQLIESIEDLTKIFESFVTKEEHTFDPRYLFMALALVCFLIEVAVRKFKFKWPHELIREYKSKKK